PRIRCQGADIWRRSPSERSGAGHDRTCPTNRNGGLMTAKLIFGLNQSLDGYVDHQEFAPGPLLFRHFIEQVQRAAGSVYGRRMYEVMRYWDEDRAEWDAMEREFAAVWRSQ